MKPSSHRNQGGFTLVELMIVVAIIAILAAIAIPEFTKMQLKSKRAEVHNCASIRHAFKGQLDDVDIPDSTDYSPDAAPGKQKRAWVSPDSSFKTLQWEPDGDVRASYAFWTVDDATYFVCATDIDGDGVYYIYFDIGIRKASGSDFEGLRYSSTTLPVIGSTIPTPTDAEEAAADGVF